MSEPVELAPVREGENLDWSAIEAYLREHLAHPSVGDLELGEPFEVQQFPHGSANLTYCLRFGATELVLRRPPFGTLAPGAHDMKREFRVLSRLWKHFDKAPRAYLLCDDHRVGGADFFVMERRRGVVVRTEIPASMRHHAQVGRRIGLALVDAMAELHRLDPAACDLADLGRPDGFVTRQVAGWRTRWDLVADPAHDAAMVGLHGRLEAAQPESQHASIVHNDLKLDNVMFDPDDPDRVRSFFDWDMTTLGDPLVDLGTLLNYWPDAGDGVASAAVAGTETFGLPTRAELVERYAARTGFDVSPVPWYEAFAGWKTATVVQQLYNRWAEGDSTDDRMAVIAAAIPERIATVDRLLRRIGA